MKTFHHRLASRLALVSTLAASAATIAACSGAPGDEQVGSSQASALTLTPELSIDSANLRVIVDTVLPGTTMSVSNSELTITPSPVLQGQPYNIKSIPPIAIPSASFTVAGLVGCTATATAFSVDPSSVTLTLSGNQLIASASGSGTFHISSSLVNPDVTLSATVTATFEYNSTADDLFMVAGSLVATSSNVSTNGCGAFGWCNGLVTDNVSVQNMLTSYAAGPLASFVSSSQATQALRGAMVAWADLQDPPPANQTPWTYVQRSASIANSAFGYEMTAVNYPATTPAPVCSTVWGCDTGGESIYCNTPVSPIAQSISGGAINEVVDVTISGTPQIVYEVATPGAFRVCNSDSYNNTTTCTNIPEPPAPVCGPQCPVCPSGYICEVVSATSAACVVNHRCEIGYHYCNGACVAGTGTCPI
jgi:hypothetical protein